MEKFSFLIYQIGMIFRINIEYYLTDKVKVFEFYKLNQCCYSFIKKQYLSC